MVHKINLNIRVLLQWIKKHANMNLSSHLKNHDSVFFPTNMRSKVFKVSLFTKIIQHTAEKSVSQLIVGLLIHQNSFNIWTISKRWGYKIGNIGISNRGKVTVT
jgi:hypothetical protein